MTSAIRAILLFLLLGGTLSHAIVAQTIETADDVLDRMRANTQSIEDLDAFLTVETYDDGEVTLTQRIRLSLLQPDRMRQEYLEPDYLAGNLSLVTGDAMWIYIAAIETWYEKDLAELSTAEQPWLVFRQYLRGVEDEFADYSFNLVPQQAEMDDPVVQSHEVVLQGTPLSEDAVYGRIDLWVNTETYVPNKRSLYDVEGNLLVELRILEVIEVADSIYMAQTLENYDETGELQSVIRYESIVVDNGLDPAVFIEEQGNSDESS